ncbi:DUF305 domain-containing protein [Promicromonospora aerolata]|uniref:DUF305 domain-containing protein n=1 Tax=Promicromonospora aerolata TaxID=195749 RepID=A0ABW4V972_9MICO
MRTKALPESGLQQGSSSNLDRPANGPASRTAQTCHCRARTSRPDTTAAAAAVQPEGNLFFVNLNLRRIISATTVAVVLGTTLAACSGADPADDTASQAGSGSSEHNDADTQFAQMMIVHHQGALEMAELAGEKAQDPAVQELAAGIASAQQPEIDTMTGWLEAWGEQSDGMAGMDHSGMDMEGMDMNGMSQEDVMAHLETLDGTEFDASFLEHMIAHHEGAVTMSEAEIEDGTNQDATALAQAIIEDQTAEIAEMEQLTSTITQ